MQNLLLRIPGAIVGTLWGRIFAWSPRDRVSITQALQAALKIRVMVTRTLLAPQKVRVTVTRTL